MKVTQLCLTLWKPMDYTVHGILQARILEWVAFPFSRGSSQPRGQTQVSCIAGGFFTSWATKEVQEYWNGLPLSSPADLPDPEIEPGLLRCRRILYQLSYQGSQAGLDFFSKLLCQLVFPCPLMNIWAVPIAFPIVLRLKHYLIFQALVSSVQLNSKF